MDDISGAERCKLIIADLHTLTVLYAITHENLDRDIVKDHAQQLLNECMEIRSSSSLFESETEKRTWLADVFKAASKLRMVISAAIQREQVRADVNADISKLRLSRLRPSFTMDTPSWSQFINAETPAVPAVQTLKPTTFPNDHFYLPDNWGPLRSTSVQVLPAAATLLLFNWAHDYQTQLDYLCLKYPDDPTLKGPIAPRLVQRDPRLVDDDGFLWETVARHTFDQPYGANAVSFKMLEGVELGTSPQHHTQLARMVGELEGRQRTLPYRDIRTGYVVRQWKFDKQ